ncbi:nuclear transport factor 2 family protein [Flagellimonas sp. GZD32]|uniref:nuclear transport factor 2 family protein n=1 Tax=Flagellimonas cixiensis TaxID=3228750 RepID=UPI0035C8B108
MKKIILLCTIAALVIGGCQNGPVRYSQDSPEIDTVKNLIANYNSKLFDTAMYADTSKTYYNTTKNPMSPSEAMEYHRTSDINYTNRGFQTDQQEYEMVITDDGERWVNCWLNWQATLAANEQAVEIPVHLTFQFIDGKIVREYGYWDPTEIVLALQKMEAEANMQEETMEP